MKILNKHGQVQKSALSLQNSLQVNTDLLINKHAFAVWLLPKYEFALVFNCQLTFLYLAHKKKQKKL